MTGPHWSAGWFADHWMPQRPDRLDGLHALDRLVAFIDLYGDYIDYDMIPRLVSTVSSALENLDDSGSRELRSFDVDSDGVFAYVRGDQLLLVAEYGSWPASYRLMKSIDLLAFIVFVEQVYALPRDPDLDVFPSFTIESREITADEAAIFRTRGPQALPS